ncbi:dolichyl-phosphate beta-glucosyltransferase [Frankia tisae]|uniref:dolichyl-phosphate beta-glucosyltransferase n=1 Tax=Frankia tisae TaxID=2950104 RepID=UPI0021BE1A45|nr:dolichyl-phosphate beta-glucosyltransferase [Frankia tisae]
MPVSVIIPAYNEAMRLPGSLPPLVSVMRKIPDAEVIVVDDGSTDGTAAVAEEHLAGIPGGRVLRLPWNSGKGAAVRAGVSVAHGASIVFMDADGASDVNDLPLLLAALEHAEVALGSRRIGDGAVRSSGRRVGSWAFNQITRSLASLDVADTQCGFKAFRGQEAKLLFSLARSSGFGFDVEVLSIARSIGYRIAEVPIRWAEIPGGTFRVTRHTPAMIVDVVRARRYLGRAAPGLVVSTPARPPAAGAPTGSAAATPPSAAADQPGAAVRREPGSADTASPVVSVQPALAVPPGSAGSAAAPGSPGSAAPPARGGPAGGPDRAVEPGRLVAGSARRAPLSPPRRPRPETVQPAAARRVDPAPDARGAGPSRTDLVVLEPVAAAAAGRASDDGGAGLILPGTTMGLPNPGVSRLASPGGARALSGGTVDEPVVTIPSPSGEPGTTAAAALAVALTGPVGGGEVSVFPAPERDGAARSS